MYNNMDHCLDVCWVKDAGHHTVTYNIWPPHITYDLIYPKFYLEQVKLWWKRIRKIVVLGGRCGLWRDIKKLSSIVAMSDLVTWMNTHIKIHQIIHLRLCVFHCFTLIKSTADVSIFEYTTQDLKCQIMIKSFKFFLIAQHSYIYITFNTHLIAIVKGGVVMENNEEMVKWMKI